MGLIIDLLSEPAVWGPRTSTDQVEHFCHFVEQIPGKPLLTLPSPFFLAESSVKAETVGASCPRPHEITVALKFASLTTSVTQSISVATNQLPVPWGWLFHNRQKEGLERKRERKRESAQESARMREPSFTRLQE